MNETNWDNYDDLSVEGKARFLVSETDIGDISCSFEMEAEMLDRCFADGREDFLAASIVAEDLEVGLRAMEIAFSDPEPAPSNLSSDLPPVQNSQLDQIVRNVLRNVRHLQFWLVTEGAVSLDLYASLSVVRELRVNLALILRLRPDLQGEQAALDANKRLRAGLRDEDDAFMQELIDSGELRVFEIDEHTEFKVVSFDSVLEGLKASILRNLPPSVQDEIAQREANRTPTR
ncbi:MAG: hypothetical protein P0Y66_07590 [Candidatus Kaistia colombiensis]|nr:MAG: hypothetical protein P0Y66_07590 [Kaistia sp.]